MAIAKARAKAAKQTADQPRMTVDEFERFINRPENRSRRFELINGIVVERVVVTQLHGLVAGNLVYYLKAYLTGNKIGRVYIEADAKAKSDNDNWLRPDISVVLDLSKPVVKKGAADELPEVAVEIRSPGNKIRDLREKAALYLEKGVNLVWLIFPDSQIVEVYRPDVDIQLLKETDTLDGFEVLPGFTLAVSALFED